MTECTWKEEKRNRAVLVGLNAYSLSAEDNATETTLEELAALLEAIRLHFGCPVAITSGFRTAAHNASIPGASPHSQHLYGRAADFRVEGVSVAEAAAYAETLLPGKGGIGRYPPRKGRACGWVHLDTRSTKARWTG